MRLKVRKDFLKGFTFAIIFLTLIGSIVFIGPKITGYFTQIINPNKGSEQLQCILYATTCGTVNPQFVVNDTAFIVINNTAYNLTELGCPLIGCYKSVKVLNHMPDYKPTSQPDLSKIQTQQTQS